MKKALALLLSLTMVAGLAACGSTDTPSTADAPVTADSSAADTAEDTGAAAENTAAEGGRVFGYTCMDLTNPFHIAMRDAIKEAVEANGDTLIAVDGKTDQANQNDAIEDMLVQNIEALFLNPVDSQSVQPALEACAAKGVPVINVDSAVADLSLVETYISSNNVQAGYLCGEEMVRLYPDGAKICIIENPLAESVVDRVTGLEQAIEGTGVEIVGRKSISTMDMILSNAEDLLQSNPDIDAFWGLNDDVSLVILGVVEGAGKADQIKVFSVDGSPSSKKSIQAGAMYASAAQSPVNLGIQAVECAYTLLDGGSVEANYSIDTTLVTPENIGEYDVEAWS